MALPSVDDLISNVLFSTVTSQRILRIPGNIHILRTSIWENHLLDESSNHRSSIINFLDSQIIKNTKIFWFQLLKFEDLLLFFVSNDRKLHIFWF